MTIMTAIGNVSNQYQGSHKKVLCVCSGGLLRSPTTAHILALPPYDYNTRSCGIADYALNKIDQILLAWAEEIVVMEKEHEDYVRQKMEECTGIFLGREAPIIIRLDIPDKYEYRNPKLIEMIRKRYNAAIRKETL